MTLCNNWATISDLGNCGCAEVPNPTVAEAALTAASEVLYVLSGRQYPGLCEAIFRPCGSHCNCEFDACGCNRLPRVFLGRDVVAVSEVAIGTDPPLDSDAYRLEDGWLVRLDGGIWPCCQDMTGELGEEGTFIVTAMYGALPTELAKQAVTVLASELVRSCTPGETCALPARVTNLTKQGVSMTLLDPMEFLDGGKTGLYLVDLFLSVANPHKLTRPSRAWSPELPVTRRYPTAVS